MRVNKNTIKDYIEGKAISKCDNQWIFHSIVENQYLIETVAEDKKDLIFKTVELLENELVNFQPYNKDIWDMIFPNWQEYIADLMIYLVVGCPNPYDAMTLISPEGEEVLIFDINRMLSYSGGIEKLVATIKNLLTHEYAHVCIHKDYPMQGASADFYCRLQHLCFDEGIAHFLSFNENIRNVDWLDKDKIQKKEKAYARLKQVISSKNIDEELLEEANSGAYWDKFGSIAGLFAIAEKFVEGDYNNNSILELYKKGPQKLLEDVFDENCNFI